MADETANVRILVKTVEIELKAVSAVCTIAMPVLMFSIALEYAAIRALNRAATPILEGSSAELLRRNPVLSRYDAVALAALAFARALPAVIASTLELMTTETTPHSVCESS